MMNGGGSQRRDPYAQTSHSTPASSGPVGPVKVESTSHFSLFWATFGFFVSTLSIVDDEIRRIDNYMKPSKCNKRLTVYSAWMRRVLSGGFEVTRCP